MSIDNSNDFSSPLPPEFEDILNFDAYIPHYLLLVILDNEKNVDRNYFINSTLYCLTNLKYFLEFLYKCDDQKLDKLPFKVLNQTIKQIIDNIKNGKSEYNSNVFTKFILEKIKLFENQSYRNPRFLIDCILNKFFLLNNSNDIPSFNSISSISNETNISFLSQLSLDSNNSDINFSVKESYGIERNTYVEDKLSIVIKKTRKCSNKNCGKTENLYEYMATLHFNLKDTNKEYSLYDCFNEFLNKKNDANGICSNCSKKNICTERSLFYEFPESIIIFIFYGKEEKNKEFIKFNYNFEEIIDFSNVNDKLVDDNLKNKKYFLSSLIACKFPKVEKDPNKDEGELFYTFCRKDQDSKFVVYNEDFILDNRIVKKQIQKLKDEKHDPKKSYPFVLIYTSIKDKK